MCALNKKLPLTQTMLLRRNPQKDLYCVQWLKPRRETGRTGIQWHGRSVYRRKSRLTGELGLNVQFTPRQIGMLLRRGLSAFNKFHFIFGITNDPFCFMKTSWLSTKKGSEGTQGVGTGTRRRDYKLPLFPPSAGLWKTIMSLSGDKSRGPLQRKLFVLMPIYLPNNKIFFSNTFCLIVDSFMRASNV